MLDKWTGLRELSQVLYALLAGDRLARSLACTGIGSRSLTTDGQALFVSDATVALDFTQPVDALTYLSAEWSFDSVVSLESCRQTAQFVFIQVSGVLGRVDLGHYPVRQR